MNEIEVISKLDHPNIVKMKGMNLICLKFFLGSVINFAICSLPILPECYVEDHNLYLVMELLSGGTLLETLAELGSYTEHEARIVFRYT